jgi:predicted HTH transcriptional regulator
MLLASQHVTPDQYASGVLAAHAVIADVFGDVKSKDHEKDFRNLREDARTAAEYLRLYNTGVLGEIAEGEATCREFKSTLRWNIKADRDDDNVTHAALKTVAAFLNSESGGTLFIGVTDSGEILGLDHDHFPNTDKFHLHLGNAVRTSMGSAAAMSLNISFPIIKGKAICRVECPPSTVPVYVKYRGDEEFFTRSGPSSVKLTPQELVAYVAKRFSKVE